MKIKSAVQIANRCLNLSLTKGQIDQKKVQIVLVNLKKLPSNQAILVLSQYLKTLKRYLLSQTLIITSSTDLTEIQKKLILKTLSPKFQFKDFQFKLDSSLLGGLQVKIGDVIYDDSLKSRIIKLANAIKQ